MIFEFFCFIYYMTNSVVIYTVYGELLMLDIMQFLLQHNRFLKNSYKNIVQEFRIQLVKNCKSRSDRNLHPLPTENL